VSYQAVGGFVFLPGDILAWMQRLNGSIQQLNSDIAASKVGDGFRGAWKSFVTRWQQFYDDHQSWWSRTTGSSADEVAAYENEYNQWVVDYKKEPGATGTFAHPSSEEHGGLTTVTPTIQAITNAALVLGGLYLAVRFLPPLLEMKKGRVRA